MNASAELLNFIYQNTQMAVTTLPEIIEVTEDESLRVHLQSQLREYRTIHDEAAKMLHARGYDEKGLSAFEKLRTYIMVNLQTMTDHSSSHLAEMLIQGSNMGIVDATKQLNRYDGEATEEGLRLMRRLQSFEQDNIERLKPFL